MLEGSCLCGSIRYEIQGKLGPSLHCHCVQCRKASGASFATNASVDDPCTIDLEWDPASTVCAGPITYRIYRDTSSPVSLASPLISGVTCPGRRRARPALRRAKRSMASVKSTPQTRAAPAAEKASARSPVPHAASST